MIGQLGQLLRLAEKRATLRRVVESGRVKAAELPQYSPMPFSSLTARADALVNKKPEPNPLTTDDQRFLNSLLANMSKSRSRVVGAHRRGRTDVRRLLSGSKLWS